MAPVQRRRRRNRRKSEKSTTETLQDIRNDLGTFSFIMFLMFGLVSWFWFHPLFLTMAVLGFVIWVIRVIIWFHNRNNLSQYQPDSDFASQNIQSADLMQIIKNDTRIMKESLRFVNHSNNIETVISRYNDLSNALLRLSEYENHPNFKFDVESPSQTLSRLENDKTEIMNWAIERAYDDMKKKTAKLKPENYKKRQLKFFDLLIANASNFIDETNDFVQKLIKDNIDE